MLERKYFTIKQYNITGNPFVLLNVPINNVKDTLTNIYRLNDDNEAFLLNVFEQIE